MNHRGGMALIRSTWASWMQYRSFFFILAFGWMVPPLTSLFIWSAAAKEKPISGLNGGEFIAYYLILILVNQLTYAQANWTVGDVIRTGILNTWLLRPVPAIYHTLASEAAGKVVTLVFVIPVACLLSLILHPELHTSPGNSGLALLALLLAWALRFLWGYWLALLAFWTTRADALLSLQDTLVFLLSGIVAPVPVLPAALQTFARVLPFRYMVGFPVELLVYSYSPTEILYGFAWQIGWLAIALMLTRILWKQGLRNYTAIGG